MILITLMFFITSNPAVDYLGEMVGRNFLDQTVNKDHTRASLLCAETVNFDGTIVKGTDKIAAHLKTVFSSHPADIHFKKILTMPGKVAIEKFGPFPTRLGKINIERALVVFGRRKSGGLVVILEEDKIIAGQYRVVALTD